MAFFTHPTSWLSCPWHSRTLTENALSRTRERVPTLTPTLTFDLTIRFLTSTRHQKWPLALVIVLSPLRAFKIDFATVRHGPKFWSLRPRLPAAKWSHNLPSRLATCQTQSQRSFEHRTASICGPQTRLRFLGYVSVHA